MLLKDKVAVIYGAGGAIGSAVAHTSAREGAKLFLTDRNAAHVEALVREIAATQGSADAATLDSVNGEAIDKHLDTAIEKTGRVDISFR
jgi:NADP-dependent 3-hydroxy acid dehydrogenase YdfG